VIKVNKRKTGPRRPGLIGDHVLEIEGDELPDTDVLMTIDERWTAFVDAVGSKKLFPLPLEDLAKHFFFLTVRPEEQVDRLLKLYAASLRSESVDAPELTLTFKPDFDKWINPFSALDYLRALKEASVGSSIANPQLRGDVTEGFEINSVPKDRKSSLGEEISSILVEVRRFSSIAAEALLKEIRKNSLVTWFDFPAPIKTACEQYLVYFIQFLEDSGIKANTEIKESAGRVLFSVTPEEGPNALQRLKEALEIYLNLPRNPDFSQSAAQFTEIAVTQLKSQVFFLQSQLELAKATIQAKDAAIQVLDFTVFQQKQLLIGGQKEERSLAKNEEPILGDTIHLTEYKGKGFRIDLPTIFRRLKRSFGVGENKPINKPSLPSGDDQEPE